MLNAVMIHWLFRLLSYYVFLAVLFPWCFYLFGCSVCLLIYPSTAPTSFLCMCISVYLSTYPCLYLCNNLLNHMSVGLSACVNMYIYTCICLLVRVSVHISIIVSVYLCTPTLHIIKSDDLTI